MHTVGCYFCGDTVLDQDSDNDGLCEECRILSFVLFRDFTPEAAKQVIRECLNRGVHDLRAIKLLKLIAAGSSDVEASLPPNVSFASTEWLYDYIR